MARPTKAGRIRAGITAAIMVLMVVLWAFRLVPLLVLSGCGWILMGLSMPSSKMFGSLPRWPQLMMALGTCLMGVGWIGMGVDCEILSMVPMISGSFIGLTGLFAIYAYSKRPVPEPPLVLTDEMKAEAGLSDAVDDQCPALQVVLLSPGPNRRRAMRCLCDLYDLTIQRLSSILNQTPSVLQTTTSRREAEFVAAQLSACGAQVDIRVASGSS